MSMTSEDRARGALLGLACGDAVGTTLEFRRPGSFEPLTDMVGGGPFGLPAGAWTDDTSMALCLAESLLDTGGFDAGDQLRRYLRWKDDGYLSSTGSCFDIGGTTRNQLERFRRTGVTVDPHVDQEAAANGSLMRLAPVPIRWWNDVAAAAHHSGESSRTTHAADRPVDACKLYGAMIAAVVGGAPLDDVLVPDFFEWGDVHPQVDAIAAGSYRTKEPPQIRGTGFCIDALEAALWVEPGQVLAGEYPGNTDPVRARDKVNLLIDAGVRTFVDLTTPHDGLAPYASFVAAAGAARGVDVQHCPMPIPDLGVIGDDGYDTILALIDERRAAGAVYVHCWGGVGRTGTVVGCLLAREIADYDSVIRRLADLRTGTKKSDRPCPETREQHDVLRRVTGRRDRIRRAGRDDPLR